MANQQLIMNTRSKNEESQILDEEGSHGDPNVENEEDDFLKEDSYELELEEQDIYKVYKEQYDHLNLQLQERNKMKRATNKKNGPNPNATFDPMKQ